MTSGNRERAGGVPRDDSGQSADIEFAGVTKRWIELAQEPMPRDLVTGQDADDVSAYVATVAGLDERSAVRAAPPRDLPPRYGDPTGKNRAAPFVGPEEGGDGPPEPPAEDEGGE